MRLKYGALYLIKNIPVLPFRKFVLPNEKITIALTEAKHKDLVEQCLLYDKEFGLPFFFNGKFNVFGCTVEILKVYRSEKNGFMRITLVGKELFRITQYNKMNDHKSYPSAMVKWIRHMQDPIKDKEIIGLFEKYCNAVALIDHGNLSLLDLMHEMHLGAETCFSIISKQNAEERESLIKKIFKYKVLLRMQRKSYVNN